MSTLVKYHFDIFAECLAFFCRKITMVALDRQASLIHLLRQLADLPGTAAVQILKAVIPLIRFSSSVRDELVTTLRKALYRKGTLSRQAAVVGYVQMLKDLKLTSLTSLSQSESYSASYIASTSILSQVILPFSLSATYRIVFHTLIFVFLHFSPLLHKTRTRILGKIHIHVAKYCPY